MNTRKASQLCLQAIVPHIPQIVGGSADLAASNLTFVEGMKTVVRGDYNGNNVMYGIREHAMGAVMNGMALHDSRLAAYQDKRTLYKSASQYTIQFIIVHIDAWLVVCLYIAKCQWLGLLCFNARHRTAVSGFFPYDFFNIRIPFSTRRTFTHPFR